MSKVLHDGVAFAIPYFIKDTYLRYIGCNEAFLELLEVAEEDVVGKSELSIDSPETLSMDQELVEKGGSLEFETEVTGPSGEKSQYVITRSQLVDSKDQVLGIVGMVRDVTEERRQTIRIQKLMILKDTMIEITHAIMDNWSEKLLFDLILEMGVEVIENSDHGTVLMKGEDDIFSPVAWVGYTDEAMENFRLPLKESFNWLATDGHAEQSVMINDITPYMKQWDLQDIAETKDEAVIWASMCSPIMVGGEVVGLMNMDSSMKDAFTEIDLELVDYMSEQIEAALTKRTLYDKVLYLSRHDEMTGLYNRREFEALTKEILTYAEKYDETFCLVLFDINDLKKINDAHGHQAGDTLIRHFAKSLKRIFRETDIFGRYGGDEFVGVFRSVDPELIKSRIESTLVSLGDNPLDIDDKKVSVSFSYGMAHYPADGKTYENLVSVADELMYAYKHDCKFN